jgi:deoxyribonucleoside regulator
LFVAFNFLHYKAWLRHLPEIDRELGGMPRQDEESRVALLAQVASWYYEDNLHLSLIAKRIGRSVSLVSRLLQAARERGLVEIRINFPKAWDGALAELLTSNFPLRRAHVVVAHGPPEVSGSLRHFGSSTADLLAAELEASTIVGVSWGTHVHSVVSSMRPTRARAGTVVQVSGAIDAGDPTVDGAQLAQMLASKLGKDVRSLHAPLIVETESLAKSLRASPSIAETLRLAARADQLLIGIGSPFLPSAGLRRAGYLTDSDLAALQRCGAVGDIAGYHINADGEVLDIALNRRIVGLHPEAMGKIANVIVVATGSTKIAPLAAALRGDHIDTLVTDAATATDVVRASASIPPRVRRKGRDERTKLTQVR